MSERVAVFGGEALQESVKALGFEVADPGMVMVVDVADHDAVARAAACVAEIPRVFVCAPDAAALLAAIGVGSDRIAADSDPAVLGPILTRALPHPLRPATRTIGVSGVRGGVGRTLLVTNLARRMAAHRHVCVVDATGSGAVAWWLRCEPRPWPELEALADELSADQLAVIASEAGDRVRVVGGQGATPSAAILDATVRAAVRLDDLVIVDLPSVFEAATRSIRPRMDRLLILAYDEPQSIDALDREALDGAWLIGSQSRATRIGGHAAFRSLPRDETALRAALGARAAVGGALGRAYDDLARLLVIDAT